MQYSVEWEKVPAISCIICAFPRTGSSLLCYGLEDSGLAGHPTEYFGPMEEARFAKRWNLPPHYSLSSYLRYVARETMTGNGVTAAKIFVPNLVHLLHRARDEFGSELSENELIEQCFPNPRYVFLRREDRIRQAISYMRAINTMEFERRSSYPVIGTAPEADLNPDMAKIGSYVETFDKQEREWQSFFRRNRITPHEVVYEELVAGYQSTVFGVLDFLGIARPDGLSLPPSRLLRQSDDVTEKMVARYAEYKTRAQAGVIGQSMRESDDEGAPSVAAEATTLAETPTLAEATTLAEVLQAVNHQLKSGAHWLATVRATYLFDLTGPGGGVFHLVVHEGIGTAGPGGVENPDVTFRMSADLFMRMKSGIIDDGAIAFLNGEVTMYGDQALAIALAPLWFEGVNITEHLAR